jgi:hypothetical protein
VKDIDFIPGRFKRNAGWNTLKISMMPKFF